MLINADLTQPAKADPGAMVWIPSPMPGVERKPLERDGGEVARATTIVRYAPDSAFSRHAHPRGEEFIVLEGIFSDEAGDYASLTYLRNPPKSSHAPHSKGGCTIFVKLMQMDSAEHQAVRIDIAAALTGQTSAAGVARAVLFENSSERVEALRLDAGASLPAQEFRRGFEVFVIEGSAAVSGTVLARHGWLRSPGAVTFAALSTSGCLLYLKSGHLPI